jgi:hypothetical protein
MVLDDVWMLKVEQALHLLHRALCDAAEKRAGSTEGAFDSQGSSGDGAAKKS